MPYVHLLTTTNTRHRVRYREHTHISFDLRALPPPASPPRLVQAREQAPISTTLQLARAVGHTQIGGKGKGKGKGVHPATRTFQVGGSLRGLVTGLAAIGSGLCTRRLQHSSRGCTPCRCSQCHMPCWGRLCCTRRLVRTHTRLVLLRSIKDPRLQPCSASCPTPSPAPCSARPGSAYRGQRRAAAPGAGGVGRWGVTGSRLEGKRAMGKVGVRQRDGPCHRPPSGESVLGDACPCARVL